MLKITELIKRLMEKEGRHLTDDIQTDYIAFVIFDIIIGFVSAVMTVVNFLTANWIVFGATLCYSLLCVLNIVMWRIGGRCKVAARNLFLIETIICCGFFCISGQPEGFSALWTYFIPSFTLAMLGLKKGSIYSGFGFLMIALIFWTPFGQSLLQYDYNATFRMRFPMIYLAFYLMAFFMEALRTATHMLLIEAKNKYQYMYKHDVLTGIYNRYGFNECVDYIFNGNEMGQIAFMILDLDRFKDVNDNFGHDGGDVVLRYVAGIFSRMAGEEAAVSRWGGEEFTLLVWRANDPVALAERIREKIESTDIELEDGRIVRITVSIGLCIAEDKDSVTISDMIKCADKYLYQAKDAGRNCVKYGVI